MNIISYIIISFAVIDTTDRDNFFKLLIFLVFAILATTVVLTNKYMSAKRNKAKNTKKLGLTICILLGILFIVSATYIYAQYSIMIQDKARSESYKECMKDADQFGNKQLYIMCYPRG